jgi:hypothetical protein
MDHHSNSSLPLKTQLVKVRNLHEALNDLVEASINSLKTQGSKNSKSFEASTLEEIASLTRQLTRSDIKLASNIESVERLLMSTAGCISELKQLRAEFDDLKRVLETESFEMKSQSSAICKVMTEYRKRCKQSFEENLKEIDIEIRKILRPLVPSDVLTEHIAFKPINPDSSLLSTLDAKEAFEQMSGKSRHDMLVETIEKAAEGIISLLKHVTYTYWRQVDPSSLGGLISPLSETLPEGFLYEGSLVEARRTEKPRYNKRNLISKIKSYKSLKLKQEGGKDKSHKLSKLQHYLERTAESMLETNTLMNALVSNSFTLSETESLVYNIVEDPTKPTTDLQVQALLEAEHRAPTNVPKIHLAEKLQAVKSRKRASVDAEGIDVKGLEDRRISRKRSLSKKSGNHIAKKTASDLNYAYSDQLLEETQFNEVKLAVTKKKQQRFSSLGSNLGEVKTVKRLEKPLLPRNKQSKVVRSVSPLPIMREKRSSRQKSVSPLRRVASGRRLGVK